MQDPRLARKETTPEIVRPLTSWTLPDGITPDESALHRLDAPHTLGSRSFEAQQDQDHPDRPDLLSEDSAPSRAERGESDDPLAQLSIQTRQLSDYLEQKRRDVEQREHRLISQLAQLDQEQRRVRMWVQELEDQLAEREVRLDYRESACHELESSCTQKERSLEQLQIELERRRADLDDRDAQLTEQEQSIVHELQQARETHQSQLEAELAEHRAALSEERQSHAAEITSSQAAITEQKDALEAEMFARRQRLEQEWIDRQVELADVHRQLEAERAELEAAREKLHAESKQERILLESRFRFQFEHLEKSRYDFEAQQREFLIEKQYLLQRTADDRTALDQLRTQLDQRRNLLDQREASLIQSYEVFERSRRVWHEETAGVREQQARAAQAWEQEQETLRNEYRRQQEHLASHAENLELRHSRLDELRQELEQTHRQILETRLAIEETTGQLVQALGEQGAQERILAARQEISHQYQKSQESLVQQRRELEAFHALLQSDRDSFRRERQAMADWITDCDARLKLRDSDLIRRERELQDQLLPLKDRLIACERERSDAEQVVRQLLRRLEELTAEQASAA